MMEELGGGGWRGKGGDEGELRGRREEGCSYADKEGCIGYLTNYTAGKLLGYLRGRRELCFFQQFRHGPCCCKCSEHEHEYH